MTGTRLDVRTPDGVLDAYTFTPDAGGPWPPVIVYMDAFGIRPQLGEMAQRLAGAGYFVVLPNLYYRTGAFAPFDREAVLVEGPERDRFKSMIQSIDPAKVMGDTAALLEALDQHPHAAGPAIGVVGYCMGGGYALHAAAAFPDRVAAAASFHGGSLATDRPDSPHRRADRMRATLYIGVAEIDATFPPEQQQRLDQALREAGTAYSMEIYKGARHGFAVNGHLAYDRDSAERHWQALRALLAGALRAR
jgi:carboxymethylenebutenolidase